MTYGQAIATAAHLVGTVATMNVHHIRAFHERNDEDALDRCMVQPGHEFLALMRHAELSAHEVTT